MSFKVDRHLWWNADKTLLVETGSEAAAFLAFPAGDVLTDDQARAVGLLEPLPVRSPEEIAEAKIRAAAPANKIGRAPTNKAASKPANEETL